MSSLLGRVVRGPSCLAFLEITLQFTFLVFLELKQMSTNAYFFHLSADFILSFYLWCVLGCFWINVWTGFRTWWIGFDGKKKYSERWFTCPWLPEPAWIGRSALGLKDKSALINSLIETNRHLARQIGTDYKNKELVLIWLYAPFFYCFTWIECGMTFYPNIPKYTIKLYYFYYFEMFYE